MTRNLCMLRLRNHGIQKFVCFNTQRNVSHASEQNERLSFVPPYKEVSLSEIAPLQTFVHSSKNMFVLTGAGISTESGIPDYRSESVGLYARSSNRPVQYMDFLKNAEIRQRYWARNYVGWPRFSSFEPNTAHKVLSLWERISKIHW